MTERLSDERLAELRELAARMAAEVATFAKVLGDNVEGLTGAEFAALFAEWKGVR